MSAFTRIRRSKQLEENETERPTNALNTPSQRTTPRKSYAVGVKFTQAASPREGRGTPLTGMTIRASGSIPVRLEAVLKLPILRQAAGSTQQEQVRPAT